MDAPNPYGVAPQTGSNGMSGATGMSGVPETKNSQPVQHHVHHSYIWLGSIRAIGVVLFAIVVTSISSIIQLVMTLSDVNIGAERMGILIAVLIAGAVFLLLCAVVFGIHAWSYRHLYYVIGDEEFSLYSGILMKKRIHVPYQKIQSIDQKASLIQRIFGVCNVAIDTAGGASNKAILVPYLTKQQADGLRVELFSRRDGVAASSVQGGVISAVTIQNPGSCRSDGSTVSTPSPSEAGAVASGANPASGNIIDTGERVWNEFGGVFAGSQVNAGAVTYEYRLSNKELFLTGLSNSTSFAIAIIIVISVALQLVSGLFEFMPASEDVIFDTFTSSAAAFGTEAVIAGTVSVVVGIAIIVWLASGVSACLSFGGFRATRRGDRIEVERGLLQHQTQSVNIDRVQSVIVKQSFIRRLIGYAQVSLGKVDAQDTSSTSSQKSGTSASTGAIVIHPFVKLARVPEIVSGLVPEFADAPTHAHKLSNVALRRGLIRNCLWQCSGFWLLVCAVVLQVILQVMANEYVAEYTMLMSAGADAFDVTFDADDLVALQIISGVLWALCVVGVLGMAFAAVRTVLWYRGSSFAFNRRFTSITNSGFSVERVLIPKSKTQFGYTKTNPLQRMAHTATLNARTAAGIGGTTIKLIDVSEEDANAWLDWLE